MRDEKYDLVKKIDTSEVDGEVVLRLNICGVRIKIFYKGEGFSEVVTFFNSYYQDFEYFNERENIIDVEIYYNRPRGIFGNSKWVHWNEWPHELELYPDPNDSSYDVLVERDFVAKVNKDGSKIFALGPELTRGTCDSIDNLISYSLGRKLLKYNAFILHAACVVKDDCAFVFFGASGAGKSTLAEQCYHLDNLKIISSDQMIIQLKEDKLIAHLMPTTIPEFPLEHQARYKKAAEVKALLHLTQKDGEFQFVPLLDEDFLKFFMRELVFRAEFGKEDQVLELSLKILRIKSIIKGEMSYPKGMSFWANLSDKIKL